MSGLNLTSFDAALKEYYSGQVVENMVYKNNPFFALVPKREDFYGDSYPVPIIIGNPQGRSATFSRAQVRGQVSSSNLKKFTVTRVHDYGIATIDNETMLASENDKGAFIKAATTEIDGIIHSLKRSIAVKQYRSGWGDIGVIAAGGIAGAVITLATIQDVTNFEIGMELMVAAAQDTGATRALGTSGNGLIVTAVNRSAGTVTFGFNVTDANDGIPLAAAGDYIFQRGDRDTSANPVRLCLSGLDAWLPFAATVSATLFFGVDRSVDKTRLAGIYYDASAQPIEEGLLDAISAICREGGAPDHAFMNNAHYTQLVKALGTKVDYEDLKVGEIGFRALIVNGDTGPVKVLSDMNCPYGRTYILQLDTWCHHSLGKPIRVLNPGDGLEMLRQASEDGAEVRQGYYANLWCEAPGWNGVAKLA